MAQGNEEFVESLREPRYGARLLPQVLDDLAQSHPERIFASIPRSADLSQGFRDVTVQEMSEATSNIAWWLQEQLCRSDDFETLAYMGISDLRYPVLFLAGVKCGYKCVEVPPFETMARGYTRTYPYDEEYDNSRWNPTLILHSSGSTGPPKPIVMCHGTFSVADNDRNMRVLPGRKNQNFKVWDFDNGGRFFSAFPPFHMAGFASFVLIPIFSTTATLVLGPPDRPSSGTLASEIMRQCDLRTIFCPPVVAEQLVQEPEGIQQLKKLDFLWYAGGPLTEKTGNLVSQLIDVFQWYGSTEAGPIQSLVPSRENWAYLEWHPDYEAEIRPSMNDVCEMVLHRGKKFEGMRFLAHTFPDVDEWYTKDLFRPHSSAANLWKFYGRTDDIIVLSNGEKFNPVPIEMIVQGHPLVMGAIIARQGFFQAALLVERKDEHGDDQTFIDEIWPVVESANREAPRHARITRSRIIVADPNRPFQRAGKGTIIRKLTIKDYETDIQRCLASAEEKRDSKQLTSDHVIQVVRSSLHNLLPEQQIAEIDNFFVLGLDSLKTIELASELRASIRSHYPGSDMQWCTSRLVYTSPTVRLLAENATVSQILCLNRSADAQERHEQTFKKRNIMYEDTKLQFFTVDYGRKDLGLCESEYARLLDVNSIIHNAWKVDFNHSLKTFEDIHIRGVRNIINLSIKSPSNPHIFFVSSISAVGNWTRVYEDSEPVPETPLDNYHVAQGLGYGESKHVAERILSIAHTRSKIAVSILRIGQIAGPVQATGGEWNKNEWLPSLVKTSKSLGAIPDGLPGADWIPIDTLAASLVDIVKSSTKTKNASLVYNLVNPKCTPWRDVIQWFQASMRSQSRIFPLADWIDTLRESDTSDMEEVSSIPALKILDFYEGLQQRATEAGIRYDTTHAQSVSPTFADLSAVNAEWVRIWLDQWKF
ncbi:hypothetical protein MMC18_007556 [Xylographa bjoerkii]|nr:hypothetical protein [Xylographa bjoerkii]